MKARLTNEKTLHEGVHNELASEEERIATKSSFVTGDQETSPSKSYSRRSFLQGALVASAGAAAGVAATGLSACASTDTGRKEEQAWMPATWDNEADFIVVGAGGAGLSAGITAIHEEKGSVLVLDAAPEEYIGGNSRVCSQIMFIPDSVSDAVTYQTHLNGQYDVEPELLEAWAENLTENIEWLTNLGADMQSVSLFAPEYPDVEGSSTAKCYIVGGMKGLGGSSCWNFLKGVADEKGLEVLPGKRVVELVFDPVSKEVFGVRTEAGEHFRANKAVVLSCGGFENNPELLKTYYPTGYPGVGFAGTPYNRGEGIYMAQSVGAAMWHMNNFAGPYFGMKVVLDDQLPEEIAGSSVIRYNPRFGEGHDYLFLGCDGKRYMNEDTFQQGRHGKVKRGGTYVTMPTPTPGWCVFGSQVYSSFCPLYDYTSGNAGFTTIYKLDPASSNDGYIELGILKKCENYAELAAVTGLSEEAIADTFETYNSYCDAGYDPDFHRGEDFYDTVGAHGSTVAGADKPIIPAFDLVKMEPPFYAFDLTGAILNSQGGPKRSTLGEVVDLKGKPIPRLYASGELGTVYSYEYNGGGNLSEAISSGRLAIRSAAELSAWEER